MSGKKSTMAYCTYDEDEIDRLIYECSMCSFVCFDPPVFENHVKNMHPNKFVSCITCKKVYSSVRCLIRHISIIHYNLYLYECGRETCTFVTTVQRNFVLHLANCKYYDCHSCKMSFSSPYGLLAHLKNRKDYIKMKKADKAPKTPKEIVEDIKRKKKKILEQCTGGTSTNSNKTKEKPDELESATVQVIGSPLDLIGQPGVLVPDDATASKSRPTSKPNPDQTKATNVKLPVSENPSTATTSKTTNVLVSVNNVLYLVPLPENAVLKHPVSTVQNHASLFKSKESDVSDSSPPNSVSVNGIGPVLKLSNDKSSTPCGSSQSNNNITLKSQLPSSHKNVLLSVPVRSHANPIASSTNRINPVKQKTGPLGQLRLSSASGNCTDKTITEIIDIKPIYNPKLLNVSSQSCPVATPVKMEELIVPHSVELNSNPKTTVRVKMEKGMDISHGNESFDSTSRTNETPADVPVVIKEEPMSPVSEINNDWQMDMDVTPEIIEDENVPDVNNKNIKTEPTEDTHVSCFSHEDNEMSQSLFSVVDRDMEKSVLVNTIKSERQTIKTEPLEVSDNSSVDSSISITVSKSTDNRIITSHLGQSSANSQSINEPAESTSLKSPVECNSSVLNGSKSIGAKSLDKDFMVLFVNDDKSLSFLTTTLVNNSSKKVLLQPNNLASSSSQTATASANNFLSHVMSVPSAPNNTGLANSDGKAFYLQTKNLPIPTGQTEIARTSANSVTSVFPIADDGMKSALKNIANKRVLTPTTSGQIAALSKNPKDPSTKSQTAVPSTVVLPEDDSCSNDSYTSQLTIDEGRSVEQDSSCPSGSIKSPLSSERDQDSLSNIIMKDFKTLRSVPAKKSGDFLLLTASCGLVGSESNAVLGRPRITNTLSGTEKLEQFWDRTGKSSAVPHRTYQSKIDELKGLQAKPAVTIMDPTSILSSSGSKTVTEQTQLTATLSRSPIGSASWNQRTLQSRIDELMGLQGNAKPAGSSASSGSKTLLEHLLIRDVSGTPSSSSNSINQSVQSRIKELERLQAITKKAHNPARNRQNDFVSNSHLTVRQLLKKFRNGALKVDPLKHKSCRRKIERKSKLLYPIPELDYHEDSDTEDADDPMSCDDSEYDEDNLDEVVYSCTDSDEPSDKEVYTIATDEEDNDDFSAMPLLTSTDKTNHQEIPIDPPLRSVQNTDTHVEEDDSSDHIEMFPRILHTYSRNEKTYYASERSVKSHVETPKQNQEIDNDESDIKFYVKETVENLVDLVEKACSTTNLKNMPFLTVESANALIPSTRPTMPHLVPQEEIREYDVPIVQPPKNLPALKLSKKFYQVKKSNQQIGYYKPVDSLNKQVKLVVESLIDLTVLGSAIQKSATKKIDMDQYEVLANAPLLISKPFAPKPVSLASEPKLNQAREMLMRVNLPIVHSAKPFCVILPKGLKVLKPSMPTKIISPSYSFMPKLNHPVAILSSTIPKPVLELDVPEKKLSIPPAQKKEPAITKSSKIVVKIVGNVKPLDKTGCSSADHSLDSVGSVDSKPRKSDLDLQRKANYMSILSSKKNPETLKEMSLFSDFFKCIMDYECNFISNSLTQFAKHAETHCNCPQCPYCLASFSKTSGLVKHFIKFHRRSIYQCSLCFYRACTDSHIFAHHQMYHCHENIEILKAKPINTELADVISHELKLNVAMNRMNCVFQECQFQTNSMSDFAFHVTKHSRTITTYTCQMCNAVCSSIVDLMCHFGEHRINLYQCLYCGFGCNERLQMLRHLSIQHADHPLLTYVRTSKSLFCMFELYLNLKENSLGPGLQQCSFPSTCYCYLYLCPELEGDNNRVQHLLENTKTNEMHFKCLKCLYCNHKAHSIAVMEKHLFVRHPPKSQLKYYNCESFPMSHYDIKELFERQLTKKIDDTVPEPEIVVNMEYLRKLKLSVIQDYLSWAEVCAKSTNKGSLFCISTLDQHPNFTKTNSLSKRIIRSFIHKFSVSRKYRFKCAYCSKQTERLIALKFHCRIFHCERLFNYSILFKKNRNTCRFLINENIKPEVRSVVTCSSKIDEMNGKTSGLVLTSYPVVPQILDREMKTDFPSVSAVKRKSRYSSPHIEIAVKKIKLTDLCSDSVKNNETSSSTGPIKTLVAFRNLHTTAKVPVDYLRCAINLDPVVLCNDLKNEIVRSFNH